MGTFARSKVKASRAASLQSKPCNTNREQTK